MANECIFIPDTSLFLVELIAPVVVKEWLIADHFLLRCYAVSWLARESLFQRLKIIYVFVVSPGWNECA